ncbi:MCE family protein [Amycolatopsis sp. K13G38]|uniref:MCE family protein n=1 Tax=Amycolatopsis acididurans TaxID=2724524 RepID=A0ABX1IW19_9PSEU|nr:MlaD family protein [Amycolatopsis acididurans]NKQ51675.1 MCE family protein [Amycolatopsis acididurans]
MLVKRIRLQLLVFAVLAAFGVGTILVNYLDLRQLFGFGQYEISVEFTDATGLYPGAMVTYRGVEIGKVRSVDLGGPGAVVTLGINESVRIPDHSHVAIRSASAIGENSVDLTPGHAGAPWLEPGARIAAADTSTLPRADHLISSLHDLAASVPPDALRTVLQELTTGLSGRGQDVGTLLDSARTILREAGLNLEPTVGLIQQLGPFLDTQHDIRDQTHSLAGDLDSFTGQLRRSDQDLRTLLAAVPPAANEVTDLENRLGPVLPQLLTDLTSTGQVIRAQLPGVSQIFVLYPAIVSALQRVIQQPGAAPGTAHLGVRLSVNDVPPCYEGFVPMDQQRSFEDTSPAPIPGDQYCKVPPSDPRAVRGARNTPCATDQTVRTARAEDCPDGGGTLVGTYDPATGNAALPDGRVFALGGTTGKEPATWQELLVK